MMLPVACVYYIMYKDTMKVDLTEMRCGDMNYNLDVGHKTSSDHLDMLSRK
jgi:hypothetical protein